MIHVRNCTPGQLVQRTRNKSILPQELVHNVYSGLLTTAKHWRQSKYLPGAEGLKTRILYISILTLEH